MASKDTAQVREGLEEGIQQTPDKHNVKSQSEQLEAEPATNVLGGWKDRFGTRYKSRKFLFVRWKSGDLKLKKDLQGLKETLQLYDFEIEEFLIPNKGPQEALHNKVVEWVKQDNSPDVLKGFISSGHGGPAAEGLGSSWSP